MNAYQTKLLAVAQAKSRIAYDLLSELWNMSLIAEDRALIGQDRMQPMMKTVKDYCDQLAGKGPPTEGGD